MRIYNSLNTVSDNFFVVDHRGYIHVDLTGTYTFTISDIDDVVYIWYGDLAISGWTKANSWSSSINSPNQNPLQITLAQGSITLIRIMFGQAQGPAQFKISVTNPAGSVFLDGSSSYLLQYPCGTNPKPSPLGAARLEMRRGVQTWTSV